MGTYIFSKNFDYVYIFWKTHYNFKFSVFPLFISLEIRGSIH